MPIFLATRWHMISQTKPKHSHLLSNQWQNLQKVNVTTTGNSLFIQKNQKIDYDSWRSFQGARHSGGKPLHDLKTLICTFLTLRQSCYPHLKAWTMYWSRVQHYIKRPRLVSQVHSLQTSFHKPRLVVVLCNCTRFRDHHSTPDETWNLLSNFRTLFKHRGVWKVLN